MKGGETCLDDGLRLVPALGSTVLGTETAGAERREALPWPLFLGDPGNKLRSLHDKVRLSALRLPSKGGEKAKSQTRAAARERSGVAV